MKIALLLHIYQPPTQYESVFSEITEDCYKKLIDLLKKTPHAKVTFNINAALTEQFVSYGYKEIIEDFKLLAERGQIEFTGSAAYHPLLFKLPKEEIKRQIELDRRINRKYFGAAWDPPGFFPPELAVDNRVTAVVEECGYDWMLVEEAISGVKADAREDYGFLVRRSGNLKIIPRTRRLSLDIAFGKINTLDGLKESICANTLQIGVNPILAMDGETFGWHQKKQLDLLEQIFAANSKSQIPNDKISTKGKSRMRRADIELVTVSELIETLPKGPEIYVGKSSWGKRVKNNGEIYYPRWENPNNPIHKLQWALTNLAIETVNGSEFKLKSTKYDPPAGGPSSKQGKPQPREKPSGLSFLTRRVEELAGLDEKERQWLKARELLDKALHSDQYFWADTDVWHFGMVEKGAKMLREVVLTLPDKDRSTHKQSMLLYDKIVSLGESLYGRDTRG